MPYGWPVAYFGDNVDSNEKFILNPKEIMWRTLSI